MIPTVNITRKENHISVEVLIARDRKDEALHDLLVTDNAGFKWSVPIRVYAYDAGICETTAIGPDSSEITVEWDKTVIIRHEFNSVVTLSARYAIA